jgi:hypothetical protein
MSSRDSRVHVMPQRAGSHGSAAPSALSRTAALGRSIPSKRGVIGRKGTRTEQATSSHGPRWGAIDGPWAWSAGVGWAGPIHGR